MHVVAGVVVRMSFPKEEWKKIEENQMFYSRRLHVCGWLCWCADTIFRRNERQRTLPYSIIQSFLSVLHEAVTNSATNTIKCPPYFDSLDYRYVWTCDSWVFSSFLISISLFRLLDWECRNRVRVSVWVVFGMNGHNCITSIAETRLG